MRTSSALRSSAGEASSRRPCPAWSPSTSTALGTCGRTCRACLHRKHTSEPRTALPKQYYRLAKGTDNMKKPTKAPALYVGKLITEAMHRRDARVLLMRQGWKYLGGGSFAAVFLSPDEQRVDRTSVV